MKKSLFILIPAIALATIFVCTQAKGQEWTAPIPVGSDVKQVGDRPPEFNISTKTAATDIKFFNHPPAPPAGDNFKTQQVTVDGLTLNISDIAGAPGLMRKDFFIDLADLQAMLDNMINESLPHPMDPAHGFCPASFELTDFAGTQYSFIFECDASFCPFAEFYNCLNMTDRQFEVADIRTIPLTNPNEFIDLIGTPPLDASGLIGDAEENLGPYGPKTYPNTIISSPPFAWIWPTPTSSADEISHRFDGIYTYGIADFDDAYNGSTLPHEQGIVTSAYDPINVEKNIKLTDSISHFARYIAPSPLYNLLKAHFGQIFYRKAEAVGKLLLAGYNSWKLSSVDLRDLSDPAEINEFKWNVLLSINLNSIDNEKLVTYARVGGIMVKKTYLATVNQATLGSLDQLFLDKNGVPYTFLSGKNYPWRNLLGTKAGGSFVPLSKDRFPHPDVSYVTIKEQTEPWVNDDAVSTLSDNPNKVFNPPKIYFSLIGPGAFHATVAKDVLADGERQYLLVASGEPTPDYKYFVYKIDPVQNEENTLYLNMKAFDPLKGLESTPGIMPEVYEVTSSETNFAPYEIKAGNFDGDKCSDFAITWRGAYTFPAKKPFKNGPGETVYFNKESTGDGRMFADYITVYQRKFEEGGKCVFVSPGEIITLPSGITGPRKQIASLAVHDFDGNGIDEIVVGNLNPELFAPGDFTGHAYIITDPLNVASIFSAIRFGYKTTASTGRNPADGDIGQYLISVAKGDPKSLAGTGVIEADPYGNMAGVQGLPLMLPPFGCPNLINTAVVSPVEIYLSLLYDKKNPGVSRDERGFIQPMRCLEKYGGSPPPGGITTLDSPKKEFFAEDSSGSNDGGGSDFARCDKVYDSKAPFIATIDELRYAQATSEPSNLPEEKETVNTNQQAISTPLPELSALISDFLINKMGLSEKEAAKVTKQFIGDSNSPLDSIFGAFLEIMWQQISAQVDAQKSVQPEEATDKPQIESNKFSFIKEAFAGPPPLDCIAKPGLCRPPHFRFPHGQVMQGWREMTFVVKKTPVAILEDCGNGTWNIGEECDPGNPDVMPPIAPGHFCDDTTLTCNSACRCVAPGSTPPDCPNGVVQSDLGEECDKLSDGTIIGSCTTDEVCSILCRCVPKTTIETGGQTNVTKCTGFTNPYSEKFFKNLNDRTRQMLPGLKTSDLWCEAEGTMETSISVSVPDADKNVGALIQRSGSFPKDTTQEKELPTKVNVITKPTKLLPIESTKALKIESPDLSAFTGLSEAVEPSADLVTSLDVGDNVITFNHVLSWQRSTAPTKEVGTDTVIKSTISHKLPPLLRSWSASGESDAFLKENSFANYNIDQVLSQLAANSDKCHDGYCELEAVKGIWPEYQTYNFMLVQGRAKADIPEMPPGWKLQPSASYLVGTSLVGQGSGCKCDMTAQPPDVLSLAVLLIITVITAGVTTGFVVVRIFNFPSFVRRGKGR